MDNKFRNDVTFVVIVSRLCNLRCRYCYEFPDLANPAKVTLEQLELLFQHVAEHYVRPTSIRFAWQGGEPLIVQTEFYREAIAAQRRIFSGRPHSVVNVIQSNLTILDDDRIAMLRDYFDGVGVSHDVVGSLRVDVHGRLLDERTRENLDRLINARIPLGGITVLSKHNIDHIPEIYRFWRDRKLPFRLLPMHRGPFPDQQNIELRPDEVGKAFRQAFDLWMVDEQRVEIAPLVGLVSGILRQHQGGTIAPNDKSRWESVLLISPDGRVGGVEYDLANLGQGYGNIFESSLMDVLNSETHRGITARASARVAAACSDCRYFKKACCGFPMANSSNEFISYRDGDTPICEVTKQTIEHIERRLTEAGFIDRDSGELRLPEAATLHSVQGRNGLRAEMVPEEPQPAERRITV